MIVIMIIDDVCLSDNFGFLVGIRLDDNTRYLIHWQLQLLGVQLFIDILMETLYT